MAETHAARLARLESRDKAILLFVEAFQKERAEYRKTIEQLKARIEKLEREGEKPPVIVWDQRRGLGLS